MYLSFWLMLLGLFRWSLEAALLWVGGRPCQWDQIVAIV